MKKILYLIIVALLTVTAGTAWGQTNRTLGDIPDGWTVKVGETPVTVTNGTATIAAGATVVLTYTGPKYVNSIDLSRKSANDINLTNANKATAVSSFNSTTDSRLLFTEDISGSLTFTSSDGEIDMNGHTNNSSDDCYIQNNVEGKSITFKNGTVSASFDGAPSWNDFYKGTVILENMTVNGSIFTDGHAYIINGGTYNKIRHYKKAGTPGTVTIYDGKFSVFNDTEADNAAQSLGGADCKGGAYILYGGKYKFNPSTTTLGREATITIPDGYSVQSNTDDDSGTYPWVVKSNSGIPANMYNLVGSQGNTVWTFTMPNYNVEMETNLLSTLGDIPTGWNVTADNVNFTASETNHEAHIPAGSTVTLTPMYPAKVKSVKLKDISEIPLTFEAKVDGFSVKLTSGLTTKPSLQYSIDGGNWTDLTFDENTATTSSIDSGQKISFRAKTINNAFGNQYTYSDFSCSKECYIYGNIMSLLSKDDFATATSVPDYAFRALFQGNDKILSHPSKPLVLPATNLAKNCYAIMFYGCTSLTTAPDLPATTLADSCYEKMFNGCTNLVTTPAISATTLAKGCCWGMFGGCTSLTTGPTLHAATLVDDCYQRMFFGCTNLNSVTCLATNISAFQCTDLWLRSVATTGTFTAHDPTVLWSDGASGIPTGWTRVNKSNIVNLASLTDHYEAQNNDTLTGTLAGNYKISIADGATVTLDNASINAAGTWKGNFAGITCLGNATIILSGTNTVKGFYQNYPGIFVPSSKTLIIQGSTGSLNASSNGYGAGIGGGFNINCGNIEIQGGVITATGGLSAAGIGGGSSASCGTITISGGNITANGGEWGAGIGTGNNGTCGNITISDGSITANGGEWGAGIGTGKNGTCLNITINNTVTSVTATKGSGAPNSIGAGLGGTCGTVTIGGVTGAITESPYTYPAPVAPSGAINGLFSVSSTKQVYFSKGNLQAVGTTSSSPTSGWTWQFAEHQWDYIGGRDDSEEETGNNYISGNGTLSANGTVDLFGWSTNATYYGIHNSGSYETIGDFVDWGNVIGTGWRTLTNDEWFWVLGPLVEVPTPGTNCRTSSTVNGVENARYAGATVAGKAGLIIFPDSYTHPGDVTAPESVNAEGAAYDSNSYDATDWGKMEAAGAVFLPAAGFRPAGNNVQECEVYGYYWSSVLSYSETAYSLTFQPNIVFPWGIAYIDQGCAVRLVKDAN